MARPLLSKEDRQAPGILMTAITHREVRRHPRWREELDHPGTPLPRAGVPGIWGIIVVGAVLLAALVAGLMRH